MHITSRTNHVFKGGLSVILHEGEQDAVENQWPIKARYLLYGNYFKDWYCGRCKYNLENCVLNDVLSGFYRESEGIQ